MKIKLLLLLPVCLFAVSLFAQQTLNISNGAQIIMQGNVSVKVDGGVQLSSASSELKVNGGTLTLNAGSQLSNSGIVTNNATISNAGTNSGAGAYKGSGGTYNGSQFVNGGTVAPGASPGCLSFGNGFSNSGNLQIEVNGKTTACTDFDRIAVTGTATLGGTLAVTIGYSPTAGDVITILDATALSGTFPAVSGLPANWAVLYDYPSAGEVSLIACPVVSADFAYDNTGYCQAGTDPTPTIYGTPGGSFSAPGAVSINATTGTIDISASTAGGPYTITYNTGGACPESNTFNLNIENCAPGATLADALVTDNGVSGKADPGDRIRLTATITNAQAADYEGVQLTTNNDLLVTLVPGSFKSTPVAVDDAYLATMNTLLTVPVGSGVLVNDFDDAALNVTAFDNPSAQGGTVSMIANGSFTYNPPNGFTGNDTFTYTVTDSDTQTNMATVKIRVQ